MTTWSEFAVSILEEGGWPTSLPKVQGLCCVFKGEGSGAQWNPTDTTLAEPGCWAYNSFGGPNGDEWHVWNYPSQTIGLTATVATIDDLANIVEVLASSDATVADVAGAFDVHWAGQATTLYASEVWTIENNWVAYSELPVSGSLLDPLVDLQLPELRYGTVDPSVESLQLMLGIKPNRPASFGPETLKAVKYAQTAYGLPANGIVDGDTWTAICARRHVV